MPIADRDQQRCQDEQRETYQSLDTSHLNSFLILQ